MRARNIKPSFFTNEVLGTQDPIIGMTFIGLWCLADRSGILEDRPLRIKAELFPYREDLDVNGYLTVLERLGFIDRYVVDGVGYIHVLNFEKHQSPHHTEKSKGYPRKSLIVKDNGYIPVKEPLLDRELTVPERSDSLIPDSLIPDSKHSSEKPDDIPSGFAMFWKSWPATQRKTSKSECLKRWKARNIEPLAEKIIAHVEAMKKTESWQTGFEPAPLTYINQKRWEDGLPTLRAVSDDPNDWTTEGVDTFDPWAATQ